MGRAEIHLHLLTGLDDRTETMEESIAVVVPSTVTGTDTVVATPQRSSRSRQGRIWLNGRELSRSDSRFGHLGETYD